MIATRRPAAAPAPRARAPRRWRMVLGCVLLWLAQGAALAAPTDVVLVLDNSGSMKANDPQFLLKRAVSGFVSALDAETRLGVVIFAEKADYPVPLAALDVAARGAVDKVIGGIDYRGQLTNSPAAIERAIYELKKNGRADAAKVIVFMTDGIVDTGDKGIDGEKAEWMREELAAEAADAGIRIFGIAFTENADFFLIQSLAKKSGGAYFRALTPDDLTSVFAEVQETLATPPAAPAAPPPEQPAAPAAPPVSSGAPAAAAGACLATLAADERIALEEMAREAGLTAEQLCAEMQAAPAGTAVVIPPPGARADDGGSETLGLVIVLGGGALLLAVAAVAVTLWLRGRRQGVTVGQAPRQALAGERIPDAFLKDVHRITSDPAIQLGAKPVMIARVGGTDTASLDYFIIDKPTVGRRHAIIRYHDFGFWIADQGSVNGTFLNGERIENERQLKHGDRVRFHKYEFEFSMPEMEDAGHTVFADPNEKTMIGDATSFGATAAVAAAPSVVARAHAADDDEDLFDITGERAGPGAADDEPDDEMETALSARARAGAADLGDETEEGDSADYAAHTPARAGAADDDDDDDLVTVGPNFGHGAVAGGEDEFDAEASAFFDEGDMGVTAGPPVRAATADMDDEDFGAPAPEAATMIRPADEFAEAATMITPAVELAEAATMIRPASALAGEVDPESATLMPGAVHAPEDALEGTSDISLDDFMRTETFDAPLPLARDDDDADDRTLMPSQVPDRGQDAPAINDVLDLTAEQTIPPVGKDEDDEEKQAGPTRFGN